MTCSVSVSVPIHVSMIQTLCFLDSSTTSYATEFSCLNIMSLIARCSDWQFYSPKNCCHSSNMNPLRCVPINQLTDGRYQTNEKYLDIDSAPFLNLKPEWTNRIIGQTRKEVNIYKVLIQGVRCIKSIYWMLKEVTRLDYIMAFLV